MEGAEDENESNISKDASTTNSGKVDFTDACDVRAKEVQRKAKLEAHLKSGCGYGKKKQKLLNAFWTIVWSGLEQSGWRKIEGVGAEEGSIFFIPPDIVDISRGKRGSDYYDRIRDVIDRVLEGRNADEERIANAYRSQQERDAPQREMAKVNTSSRPRRTVTLSARAGTESSSPAKSTTDSARTTRVDLSWKDGGTLYPKGSSRIGDKYQANNIPEVGTHMKEAHSNFYELVWDPKVCNSKGVEKILEEKVPHNKKEQAVVALGIGALDKTELKTSNITEILSHLQPIDGSDWSKQEKDRFHEEIFRVRKDMTSLSKLIGKDLKTCLTYYLGTYKKSDDYRLLKIVCVDERNEKAALNIHGVDACAICGDGGSLLICDGCEGEYHMGCLRPPLKSIPEGHWECDECVDKKLLNAREQIIVNSRLYENFGGKGTKRKADEFSSDSHVNTDEENTAKNLILRPSPPVVAKVKAFANEISNVLSLK